MIESISFNAWPNCLRLSNAETELIVSTDIGPRILFYGFKGGQNFFHLLADQAGKTGGDEWRIYGGHRFWHGPEAMPRSYSPDNDPVAYKEIKNGVHLIQKQEPLTGISKELEITISPDSNSVKVLHRLVNNNLWEVELAPWALSALAAGGKAIIPQEKYGEADVFLLPARPLALWHFTKMNDPRWIWGEKYIRAIQVPNHNSEQKIGVANSLGWNAYSLNKQLLIKKFGFDPKATYCDFGSNNEIYINGQFLEMETLSPLEKIAPGASVEHTESWMLTHSPEPHTENEIDELILPKVNAFIEGRFDL